MWFLFVVGLFTHTHIVRWLLHGVNLWQDAGGEFPLRAGRHVLFFYILNPICILQSLYTLHSHCRWLSLCSVICRLEKLWVHKNVDILGIYFASNHYWALLSFMSISERFIARHFGSRAINSTGFSDPGIWGDTHYSVLEKYLLTLLCLHLGQKCWSIHVFAMSVLQYFSSFI